MWSCDTSLGSCDAPGYEPLAPWLALAGSHDFPFFFCRHWKMERMFLKRVQLPRLETLHLVSLKESVCVGGYRHVSDLGGECGSGWGCSSMIQSILTDHIILLFWLSNPLPAAKSLTGRFWPPKFLYHQYFGTSLWFIKHCAMHHLFCSDLPIRHSSRIFAKLNCVGLKSGSIFGKLY